VTEISVGSRVKDFVYLKGMTGTVIEVIPHNLENPVVEHGFITVRLDPECVGKFPCSPPNEEHYVHYQWDKCLELIP